MTRNDPVTKITAVLLLFSQFRADFIRFTSLTIFSFGAEESSRFATMPLGHVKPCAPRAVLARMVLAKKREVLLGHRWLRVEDGAA